MAPSSRGASSGRVSAICSRSACALASASVSRWLSAAASSGAMR
ncbi:Uncharacterised protein [Bordetella pertussis]|nr:Uncharacterised protein [Bordetella pertussis]